MKIRDIQHFRFFYKTGVRETLDTNRDENFIGSSISSNGRTQFGFFDIYHGDKPKEQGIEGFLRGFLDMAQDSQAIYEFLQNAVDANSTTFEMYYDDKYFLAFNNGFQFNFEGIRSILNVGVSTKSQDSSNIGKFGIGFKLIHRLVGEKSGLEELKNLSGPILFSWGNAEQLQSLQDFSQSDSIDFEQDDYFHIKNSNGKFGNHKNLPWLFKILLTNFPCQPEETIKNLTYQETKNVFSKKEVAELAHWAKTKIKVDTSKHSLNSGSLFFLRLGKDKGSKLSNKRIEDGIQFSLSILNHIAYYQKKQGISQIRVNENVFEAKRLFFERFVIKFGSEEYNQIKPQRRSEEDTSDIEVLVGFMDYKTAIKEIKGNPNFYLFFPLSEEVHNLSFIIHSTGFYNASQRTNLQGNENSNPLAQGINETLLGVIAEKIKQKLLTYFKDSAKEDKFRYRFLNIYSNLLLSDIATENHKKWIDACFIEPIFDVLKIKIPTQNGYSDTPENVKIKDTYLPVNPSDFGCPEIEWFAWLNEKSDKELIDEAKKTEKLNLKSWNIVDLIDYAVKKNNIEFINTWIKKIEKETSEIYAEEKLNKEQEDIQNIKRKNKPYYTFLNEINKNINSSNFEFISKIKFFKFTDNNFYSINEIISEDNLILVSQKTYNVQRDLKDIGFIISYINIEKENIEGEFFYQKINNLIKVKLTDKLIYEKIELRLRDNTLKPKQKERIFRSLIDFKEIGIETLKKLKIFQNSNGEIQPLNTLISSKYSKNIWLKPYKIDEIEYFQELDDYLVKPENIFKDIISPNIYIIKDELTEAKEIKELVNFFKVNLRPFFNEFILQKQDKNYAIIDKTDKHQIVPPNKATREFIDKHLSYNLIVLPNDFSDFNNEDGIIKSESLHSIILDLVDVDEHKEILVNIAHYKEEKILLLQKLSEIRLVSKKQYEKESYEYKVLELACEVIKENEILNFKEKIIIEIEGTEYLLSEIPPFKDKIKIDEYELNLAKLLPDIYANSDHLSSLINQFIGLGLSKERIGNLFGVSEEPEELSKIFQLFSEQVESLENAEQLAFVILYNKHIKEINLKTFKVLAKGTGVYDLTYNFYTKQYKFLKDDAALDDKFNGIKEILKILPFVISDENQILEEPYFLEDNFICPDIITENLTEEQKLSLINFLFNQWNKKNKKTAIKNIDWSIIDNTETVNILGFNPTKSVYPSRYACESEVLPNYIIKWIDKEESKIDFLTDLGVWTEKSVIAELRKYLSDKIKDLLNNRIAQETRFNKQETVLFNTFEWLKEKEITLKTAKQFETFKKVVEIINENRDNNDLLIQDEYDFEELKEKSTEWKSIGDFSIYLYKGALPRIVKIDEIQDYIFYRYSEGDYAVNGINIYLNENEDKTNTLQKVALDRNNSFTSEDSKDIEISELKAQLKKSNKEVSHTNKISLFDEDVSFLENCNLFSDEIISNLKKLASGELIGDDRKNMINKLVQLKFFSIFTQYKYDETKIKNNNFISEEGISFYFHSARNDIAYVYIFEINKAKANDKFVIDFGDGTNNLNLYSKDELLELNVNHILFCDSENVTTKINTIIENKRLEEKMKLLVVNPNEDIAKKLNLVFQKNDNKELEQNTDIDL